MKPQLAVKSRPLFEETLRRVINELGAERAIVLYGGDPDTPTVRAAHGVESDAVWSTALLSLSVLRRVLTSGEPMLSTNAQEDDDFAGSASLLITGIRTIICAPLWKGDGVWGLVYADRLMSGRPFSRKQLNELLGLARLLEQQLEATLRGEIPPSRDGLETSHQEADDASPLARHGVRASMRPRAGGAPAPRPQPLTLPVQSRIVFLQSLSVMMGVGVSLSRSLALLGEDGDDPRGRAVAARVWEGVERGQPLSRAMASCGPAFTPLQIRLLEIADRTGSIDVILRRLAAYDDRTLALLLRVRSHLTYPLVLGLLCGVFLLVLPPLLLRGQLEALRSAGMSVPAVTQWMLRVSEAATSLPGVFVGMAGAFASVRFLRHGGRAMRALRAFGRTVPHVGDLLVRLGTARFAAALEMQLEAGVSILEAVPSSAAAAGDPVLLDAVERVVEGLREGSDLTTSLGRADFFPRDFLALLTVGEESGELPRLLEWVSRHYESEVDRALETAASAIEPLMLMILGAAAAAVCLATMLPLVKMVQQL